MYIILFFHTSEQLGVLFFFICTLYFIISFDIYHNIHLWQRNAHYCVLIFFFFVCLACHVCELKLFRVMAEFTRTNHYFKLYFNCKIINEHYNSCSIYTNVIINFFAHLVLTQSFPNQMDFFQIILTSIFKNNIFIKLVRQVRSTFQLEICI